MWVVDLEFLAFLRGNFPEIIFKPDFEPETWVFKVPVFTQISRIQPHFVHFVMEIFKIFASGQALEPEYQHDLDWQPDQTNCPTTDGPYSDKKCCGQYPIRSPFKTLSFDQERDCCADQVYTKLYKVCCDDETLGSIGDCV